MAFTRQGLEQYANKQRNRFEELLKEFVQIPSVSADPDRKHDLERCAELGLETVRALGGRAEIHRVPDGPPLVHGVRDPRQGPADRDDLHHLDVVPASRETEPWRTDPFTFTKDGDTYFGRGTIDDKGPALSSLRRPRRPRGWSARQHQDPLGAGGGGRRVREGGTIGAVLFIEQILKCPIVFIGLSLPEHGYHAPNENYDWHQAGGGIVVFARFFEEVANH